MQNPTELMYIMTSQLHCFTGLPADPGHPCYREPGGLAFRCGEHPDSGLDAAFLVISAAVLLTCRECRQTVFEVQLNLRESNPAPSEN
jgi:hypothetical protein